MLLAVLGGKIGIGGQSDARDEAIANLTMFAAIRQFQPVGRLP